MILDVNGNKRQTNSSSTSSESSNISTKNLAVRTGKENTTSFQGSNITVSNDASIDTGELNLLASQDTYNESMDNKSINGSISITTASTAPTYSMGVGKDKSSQNNTTHNNTKFNIANNLNIRTQKDMNIKGANVIVGNHTSSNIKGDLNIISLRDVQKTTSSSSSLGLSAGGNGISGGNAGVSVSKSNKKTVV
ncbi:MAG: hemagglutinin repeat-containing protein [Campylobacteraceae bacterium]|nr:hemagglutinin repeat-containing protein [Campylobacteraceae bacterium]